MSKVRNYHFDNIKALLIFLVVFGHMIEPLRNIELFEKTYFIIYSFHMPLFIFISGYFARANTKGIKKLALLLIKYEVIYSVVFLILFGAGGDVAPSGTIFEMIIYALQPIWVLWFLLSLICWRFLLIAYEKHPIAIVIIISLIIGFNFIPFDFRVLSIGRTLSFFPYFLLGYLAKKKDFDFHRVLHNRTITFYLASLVVLFWILYSGKVVTDLLYGASSFSYYSYTFLELVVFKANLYLIAVAASIVVINLVPSRQTRFSDIGPKTLPIYLWHPIIIWLLTRINFFEQIQQLNIVFAFIILLILSGLVTLFLKDQKV